MRQIVEDRQTEYREPTPLEVLPGGRDPRAQKERQKRLAVRAKTDRKAAGKLLAEILPRVRGEARRHLGQGVDLHEADLSGANLSGTKGITNEQLEQQAKSLEGAIMPDGQKYEDWIKSKGCGEYGESRGPS